MAEQTPMMRQYLEIKAGYPDAILFFRMGDFYEMFLEDALLASRILDITLTSRNKGSGDEIPFCGVPYHSVTPYIAKLIETGHKVAICEQVEADAREQIDQRWAAHSAELAQRRKALLDWWSTASADPGVAGLNPPG